MDDYKIIEETLLVIIKKLYKKGISSDEIGYEIYYPDMGLFQQITSKYDTFTATCVGFRDWYSKPRIKNAISQVLFDHFESHLSLKLNFVFNIHDAIPKTISTTTTTV